MSRRAPLEAAPNARTRLREAERDLLSPRDLALAEVIAERAAERAVELLRADGVAPVQRRGLLSAAELAQALNVSRRFVYEHRAELGGEPLGGGSRPRLRFDLEAAREAMQRYAGGRSQPEIPHGSADPGRSRRRKAARLPNGLPQPGSVLARRGPVERAR